MDPHSKQTLNKLFFTGIFSLIFLFVASQNAADYYVRSSDAFRQQDYYEAIQLGIKAKSEASRRKDLLLYAKVAGHLARIYEETNQAHDAIENYSQALGIFIRKGDLRNQSKVYEKLGSLHLRKGENSLALRYFLKGYALGKVNGLDSITGLHAGNLGVLYCKIGNFESARKYLMEAAETRERCKDFEGVAYANGNLAMMFDQQRKDSLAVVYYKKTLTYCKGVNDSACLANVYNNLGVFYEDRNKKFLALDYYLKSLAVSDKESQDALAVINCNVANIYLEQGDLNKASFYAERALRLSKKSGFTEDERDALDMQRKIAEKKEDWNAAYRLLEASARLSIDLQKKAGNSEIMREEMEHRISLREKEQVYEKKLMKEKMELISIREAHYKNLMNWILISLCLVVAIITYFLIRLNRSNLKLKVTLEKISEANRQQEALTGIVAHDLKTPMSQINGLSNLLRMEGLNASQEEIVSNMVAATSGGIQLIEDMLAVNRLENKSNVSLESVMLNEIMDEVALAHQNAIKSKQLTLTTNSSEVSWVISTHDWAFRMIDNLLTNAIKFSPSGGLIHMWIERQGKGIALHVKDNGPGIDQAELPLLFKKFQRLSNSPTMGESSYGLGLYIVKFLAEKSKVHVLVDTAPGKGTRFTLLFTEAQEINN